MKRVSLLLGVVALVAFLALSGCATPETITGTWTATKGYSTYSDATFEFTADKMIMKYSFISYDYTVTYSYSMSAGVITVKDDGKAVLKSSTGTETTGSFNYSSPFVKCLVSVSGSEMTWSHPDTFIELYKFKKK